MIIMTMNSDAGAKKFLTCSILFPIALACCFHSKVTSSNSCTVGFCSVVPIISCNSRSYTKDHHHHHHHGRAASRRTVPVISPWLSSVFTRRRPLHGYANVNDYFASFNSTIGSSSSATGTNERNDEDGTTITTTNAKKFYIGHGRISNDVTQIRGGLFDVNNYFSSLSNNQSNVNANQDHDNNHGDQSIPPPPSTRAAATTTTNDRGTHTDDSARNYGQQSHSVKKQRSPPTVMKQAMSYQEIVASNNARLCPKLLLTQRAIQSFVYLLEECRDPHSGMWIEDFLDLKNLGNYHGTGAINVTKYPTWDSVLHDMLNQPNTHITVSAKRRGRGHGGWSKNNPYLQERYVDFHIDIRPASLVQRILSVRGQLASEFERDLDIINLVDERIMDSYFDKLRASSSSSSSLPERHGNIQQPSLISPTLTAFDRISIEILNNITEVQESGSSPFRRGNFDLLYNLATHASAHRLLRELYQSSSSPSTFTPTKSSDDDISFRWFKKFYTDRVSEYFDGDQPFGRGDDFMDALLTTPPTLVEMSDGKSIGLTDPLRIAERIIEIRSTVAQEWKRIMNEQVRNDHIKLNDVIFRVMMGRTMEESREDGVTGEIIEATTTPEELADTSGVFE